MERYRTSTWVANGAMGQVGEAAPAKPQGFDRRACAVSGAKSYLDSPEVVGGPPTKAVRYRATLGMHSLQVIAEDSFSDGRLDDASDSAPGGCSRDALHGQDTLTYFYFEPRTAAAAGWKTFRRGAWQRCLLRHIENMSLSRQRDGDWRRPARAMPPRPRAEQH